MRCTYNIAICILTPSSHLVAFGPHLCMVQSAALWSVRARPCSLRLSRPNPSVWLAGLQAACVGCLLEVARGMRYIQARNIIHGDLKPSNVLLKRLPKGPAEDSGSFAGADGAGNNRTGRFFVCSVHTREPCQFVSTVAVQTAQQRLV